MDSPGKRPPKHPHPSAAPRIAKAGSAARQKTIFSEGAGADLQAWSVTVTPLRDVGGLGAQMGGGRLKARAVFEVRADYYGLGLPEFGSQPGTHRIENFHIEDQELAEALARMATEKLRAGGREIPLNEMAQALKANRAWAS